MLLNIYLRITLSLFSAFLFPLALYVLVFFLLYTAGCKLIS